MSMLVCREWGAVKRTLIRYIRPGDVFCLTVQDRGYGYGRIIARVSIGHTAEIFDHFTAVPATRVDPESLRPAHPPVVIDSYSLFDRKSEGDYRIIAHDRNFDSAGRYDNTFFSFGVALHCKRVDVFGNTAPISEEDARSLPRYSPKGDRQLRELFSA